MAAFPTVEEARPSRGGRPRDPSRDGVIRAAILQLLADVGYGALTMDAVAAEAGVGKATIYRRWRTKQDLVVDTISDLTAAEAQSPDTGSLEGDLRELLHTLVGVVNGPTGAATLSLLSTVPRHPALAEAFRNGPLAVWQQSFDRVWEKAEARGEVGAGFRTSVAAESIGALIVQRWLLTGLPVDVPFADEVLDTVVMPLVRASV
ncbi:TetR/AcrR family transcriptional regulator [Blastococcus saxobsidens]|uniref:TetR/AcrR family transcriptional regulator n=1 Tax=Blastococcus saxobsidens TaxID=138336 RepID=UPI000CEB8482|nr:TetR/AcrR family transcriptional regulator [Blastococcus saxobsidens]